MRDATAPPRLDPLLLDGLAEGYAGDTGAREHAEGLRFAGTDLGGLYANLADLQQVSGNEESHLAGLAEQVAPAPVVRVPFLETDVHDLDGLSEVARHLFPT